MSKFYGKSAGQERIRWLFQEHIMDVNKILVELRLERQQIEEAIISLERLARGRGRRRGRPPKWLAEATHPRRGRPPKAAATKVAA